ncbi:prepilin-type N-terminal cleavage/methylation domain-containing protein [Vibrio ponticus]|uniref:Prepilin-type N-terminal cleavage/methylation domain-containing protein n=1 Tax=Vibrio ponticus TaxID=265668 RepID=A0A3N3E5J5_9VIBR|nr:prepilin-type N-terminal cleavage/methylation domain-containing protein [Vibrio ponticus]ROV61870.1 prepilin-type N-terminal cleavage/methylation domain-containing protein [Vibrio ponticus]
MIKTRGFTLIESVIAMVIMAVAMLSLSSFLFPQLSRSADPHYQTRAAALGQSIMTKMLASKFDHHSDDLGAVRCSTLDGSSNSCTLIADLGDEGESPQNFNDVDDFSGCWVPNGSASCGDLYALISQGEESGYHNFKLDINVAYSPSAPAEPTLKQLSVVVSAGSQTPIKLIAYRGNY